ncbi:hypothetical protein HYI19_18015 [Clostridium botulinum]|uniref:hypothetical protein n=1 Tax=Clostridium botulinum TaxID=1491 RepID=UPI001C9B08FA|nr:hypothetical protein [Clostridium botulinum]MBY6846691.1 hypothetical protein [Clostridium botulinum]
MLNITLYIDKETEVNIREVDNTFCLNLNKLFDFDLSIVGKRQVFEKIYEALEENLYEYSYRELEEQLVNKELLLEQAQSQIEYVRNRINFLER